MEAYFDMLKETLEENNLTDKPCQIFNMDETGLPLSSKPPKLLCKTGSRAFNAVSGGDKSQITVVGTGGYQVSFLIGKLCIQTCRAGATGPVGPVLAGPIFVRKRGVTGCALTL